ncbi:MAG: hypothetical protein ACREF0_11510 [Acetobacteraceae bacterium]
MSAAREELIDGEAGIRARPGVRDHEIEHGTFFLDPCTLHPGEERIAADRLDAELERARGANAPIGYARATPSSRFGSPVAPAGLIQYAK